jgi:signal transduction histidine kinase
VARPEVRDRVELARLADEQAALRRLATLVATGAPPAETFEAVIREIGRLLPVDAATLGRYEDGDTLATIGFWSGSGERRVPLGRRHAVDSGNLARLVLERGGPARVGSSVGAPVIVEGRIWGIVAVTSTTDRALPADTEDRLAAFAELLATAIANAQSREDLTRLAEEQAALRRVATLVAEDVPAAELSAAVVEEVGRLLRSDLAGMIRYESDGSVRATATWAAEGEHPPVEGRWPLEGDRLATAIARTGRPAREDDWNDVSGPIAEFVRGRLGIASSVGSPIVVEGRVWGALFVHSKQRTRPLPAGTESRLMNFTELVATAMSNAQARVEVHRLADEQAALRRVATLVAQERPPAEVFAAVAEEVGRLLNLEDTRIVRYEPDQTATVVASWGLLADALPVGTRVSQEGDGVPSAVGAPIVVDGRLWGAMSTASLQPDRIPADTEARMGQFTELVATAISNVEARSDLAASRARIVAAADEERERVVRDLHDGAQQRLVHTVITLKLARRALEQGDQATTLVSEALDQAERATGELRELSHGILPAVLARGGLRAGVEALASRAPVPVELGVSVGRLPASVEATAYFVVAEALTNVAKHSRAARAEVTVRVEDRKLRLQVSDDGVGGAQSHGTGLLGLGDRLAALDGRLRVESPPGGGTLVAAEIPVRG